MSKFVVVSKAPESLEKDEFVIKQPDFMEQILANEKKSPRNHQTAVNHLREVLQSIGVKYDSELNAMRIRLVNYTGLPFKTPEDFSTILVKILRNEYPVIFQKVLEYDLTHRPRTAKLVYYVGDSVDAHPFFKAGLDSVDEKELASLRSGKPKRTVGKPAITNEEAQDRGED